MSHQESNMNNKVNHRTPLASKKMSQRAGDNERGKDRGVHKMKSQEARYNLRSSMVPNASVECNQPPSRKSLRAVAVKLKRWTFQHAGYEPPKKKAAMDEGHQINFDSSLPSKMIASEQSGKQKRKYKSKQTCLAESCIANKPHVNYEIKMGTSTRGTEFGRGHAFGLKKVEMGNTSNVSTSTPPSPTPPAPPLTLVFQQPTMTPMQNANTTAAGTAPAATNAATKQANAAAVAASATSQRQKILNWTVADVYSFIKNLPYCADYVGKFAQHEIDGQALLLLEKRHLMTVMGMKSRPASILVAKIISMKKVNDAGDVRSSCNNNK